MNTSLKLSETPVLERKLPNSVTHAVGAVIMLVYSTIHL